MSWPIIIVDITSNTFTSEDRTIKSVGMQYVRQHAGRRTRRRGPNDSHGRKCAHMHNTQIIESPYHHQHHDTDMAPSLHPRGTPGMSALSYQQNPVIGWHPIDRQHHSFGNDTLQARAPPSLGDHENL